MPSLDTAQRHRRTRVLIALVSSVVLALAVFSCSRQPARKQAILIVLDAARPDRFSGLGYGRETTPRLDALAAEGAIFRNHFAQGTDTRTTLPPLLYSRYYVPPLFPADARVPFAAPEELFRDLDDEALSLPEALTGAGLRTAMISAHIWLQEDSAFGATFDEAHDLSKRLRDPASSGYPDAAKTIDYALAWLDDHRDEDFFLYLHLMDTHFPHAYGEDAQSFLPASALDPTTARAFSASGMPRQPRRPLTPNQRGYWDALYDGSLRFVDRHLGRLFDRVDAWDSEVLIAVTADHGEHLLEVPGRVLHGGPWLDAVARVPLILRYRGVLPSATVDTLTESIDVMPTLLGLLGATLPNAIRPDGRDLRPLVLDQDTGTPVVLARGAIRDQAIKCLFQTPDHQLLGQAPPPFEGIRGQLFDLMADPLETVDQWAERPEDAARCLERYRRQMTRRHRRYQDAVRTTPPPSPFALSAAFFGMADAPRTPLARLASSSGAHAGSWASLVHKQRTFLIARTPAPEQLVRVSVPNGRYALELGHRGACNVTLDDRDPVDARTRAFDPKSPRWSMRSTSLGDVHVTSEQLSLRLAPSDDGALCMVGHLGFTPLDSSGKATAPDHERRERLRALGYLD